MRRSLIAYSTSSGSTTTLVELTAVNFDQLVTNGSVWFVMLYSPSCGHCKRMTPTLEQLARDYVRQPQQ